MKTITVIISVYNQAEVLLKALLSVQAQSLKPDEVILSDDGSSENIVDIVSRNIHLYDFRIKHIYQTDNGFRLAKARNNAIRHAEGEFLVFWDQDVWQREII